MSSTRRKFNPKRNLRLESLEERTLLNSAPVLDLDTTQYSITAGQPWYIPLRSTDADGDAVYYIVETQSEDLNASLSYGTAYDADNLIDVANRNPYWKLTVEQAGADGFSGSMLFELFADKAPKTVSLIKGLTDYTVLTDSAGNNYKFYDNMIFHRIVSGFVSQAGLLNKVDGSAYYDYQEFVSTIDDEFNEVLRFTSPGVLGMANAGARDSGSCQFFITEGQVSSLDFLHTVFGFLNDGADIMEKLNSVATSGTSAVSQSYNTLDSNSNWTTKSQSFTYYPNADVFISKAEIVTNYTGSTLTVSASADSSYTTTLTVTPVDANGNRGESRTITVLVTPETEKNYNAPPILDDSQLDFLVYEGKQTTCQIKYIDLEGDAVGFHGTLYTIESDASGNGSYVAVKSGYNVDYETGVFTFDGTLPSGNYYLYVYVGVYDATVASLASYSDHRWITVVAAAPAPGAVSLNASSDTGVVGDGITQNHKNLSFVVGDCQEGYTIALVAKTDGGDQIIGSTECAAGQTSVTINTAVTFQNGTFELYAIQIAKSRNVYYDNYGWRVFDVYSEPGNSFALTISFLATPVNLKVSDIFANSIKASWDAVENAQRYQILWKKASDSSWIYDETSSTSYVIAGLDPGEQYNIKVRAYNSETFSDFLVLETPVQTLYQLAAPTEVNATAEIVADPETEESSLKITVSWEAAENVLTYIVFYKETQQNEWQHKTVSVPEDVPAAGLAFVSDSVSEEVSSPVSSPVSADAKPLELVLENLDPSKIYEFQVISYPDEQSQPDYDQSIGVVYWTYAPELEDSIQFLEYSVQSMEGWLYDTAVANGMRKSLTSVQEWQTLLLELWDSQNGAWQTGDAFRFVIRYDSRLWTADPENIRLVEGVSCYSTQQNVEPESPFVQLNILISVTDATKIGTDGLFAYVPLYSADQSNENAAGKGVAATEIKRDTTIQSLVRNVEDGSLTVDENQNTALTVWAVPYDLDDSGKVDMADFIQFAQSFNQTPISGEGTITEAANFDGQATVSMADFILFAQHFNLSWSQNPSISIPLQTAAKSSASAQSAAALELPAGAEVAGPESVVSESVVSEEVPVFQTITSEVAAAAGVETTVVDPTIAKTKSVVPAGPGAVASDAESNATAAIFGSFLSKSSELSESPEMSDRIGRLSDAALLDLIENQNTTPVRPSESVFDVAELWFMQKKTDITPTDSENGERLTLDNARLLPEMKRLPVQIE